MISFTGLSHIFFGIGTSLMLGLDEPMIVMSGIGSLFPDIDHPYSLIGRYLPFARLFNLKHRGFTHSLFGLVIFSGIVSLFSIDWGIGFFIGYLAHLLADSLTPTGVAWFYPVVKDKKNFLRIRTGSFFEYLLSWFFIIFSLGMYLRQ